VSLASSLASQFADALKNGGAPFLADERASWAEALADAFGFVWRPARNAYTAAVAAIGGTDIVSQVATSFAPVLIMGAFLFLPTLMR